MSRCVYIALQGCCTVVGIQTISWASKTMHQLPICWPGYTSYPVTCSWQQGQFIQEMMQGITAADTGQQSNIAKLIIVSTAY